MYRSSWTGLAIFLPLFLSSFFSKAQIAGENCETAIVITAPSITTGNNLGASDDYNEACPYVNVNGRDMVYEFTPVFSGVYDISLCLGLTDFDTKLYIYTDSCPTPGSGISGLNYACSDDECENDTIYPHEWVSEIQDLFMAEGSTYYIVVDGYDGLSFGSYSLSLQPDFTFPNSSDLSILDGRCYNYTEIPFYNIQPAKFEATIQNQGFTNADSAYVKLDIYRQEEIYVSTIFTDSTAYTVLPAMTEARVIGTNFWFPPDTGMYVFRYTVKWEGLPDDTIANDTLYSSLYINQSTQRTNFLGLPIVNALSLPGGGSLSEYGVTFRLYKDVDLKAVLIDLQVKPSSVGEAVMAKVYRALPHIDTLELVASNIAMELAEIGTTRYKVPFSKKLDAGTYVLTYEGSNAIIFSRHIHTEGVSNLTRHHFLTGGNWVYPPGPVAYSIALMANLPSLDTVECSIVDPPQNFIADLTDTTLELSWDPVPRTVGCRVRAGPPGSSLPKRFNILNYEASSITLPRAPFPPVSFEFGVRCACSIAPVLSTPLSNLVLVDFSDLKLARGTIVGIHPNPVRTTLQFTYALPNITNGQGEASLEGNFHKISVVDQLGRIVLEDQQFLQAGTHSSVIDIAALPSGFYFLKIEGISPQPFVVID